MDSANKLDEFDRKLLQAMQLDGRAPFSRIASVLGVSDQTVARRFQRLRASGNLRVVGVTDENALGRSVWAVRLLCAPDAAKSLAEALARRPDTSYVALISGDTEVSYAMRPRSKRERDELLDRLRRTPRVLAVNAHCLLHVFYSGPLGGLDKIDALSPEEEAALRPPEAEPAGRPVAVDDADEALISVLRHNGRAALTELRAASGLSEDAVRHRLARLRAASVLHFNVQYTPELLGQDVTALLWLKVAPTALPAVGHALAEHREVNFAAAVTGQANIFAVLVCRDTRQLYTYLSEKVRALDGVQVAETALVLEHYKQLALEPAR